MKKLSGICVLVAALGFSSLAQAQSKLTSAEQDVKKEAKKVGNKSAELASKSTSQIMDEEYKDKTGPAGETIYVDRHSKYYWIDTKGHHHYVKETQLKAKQETSWLQDGMRYI